MEFDERTPIYLQIIQTIKRDLISGKIRGGDKLASMREMAQIYQVNPNTMQRVYQELEKDGITYTQRGLGTFITEDSQKIEDLKQSAAKELLQGFIDGMKSMGFEAQEIRQCVEDYFKGEGI